MPFVELHIRQPPALDSGEPVAIVSTQPAHSGPSSLWRCQGVNRARRGRERQERPPSGAPVIALSEAQLRETVECACGCGELIPAINTLKKPATYKLGHNSRVFNGGGFAVKGKTWSIIPECCRKCGEPTTFDQAQINHHDYVCGRCEHERAAQRWKEHADADKQRHREWRLANIEHVRKQGQLYRAANVERIRLGKRRFVESHREYVRAVSKLRKARTKGSRGYVVLLSEVTQRDKSLCGICGKKVSRAQASLDHIVPLAYGGLHVIENLQLAHLTCNKRRGAGRIAAQIRLAL
jgi:5-methylcytosine-specific restriction endonuclease McrA